MALHPAEMDAAIIRNLAQKTGYDLKAWIAILKSAPNFEKSSDAVKWLKSEHGLGHVTAMLIVKRANQPAPDGPTVLLDKLFETPSQRKLFNALRTQIEAAVSETIVTPCKTYAGFGNPRQYAVVKPDRQGGLTVGSSTYDNSLAKPVAAKGLGGGDRICWKVEVSSTTDIDVVIRHLTAR
jgi:Domain of unknown function (DUF4287)/Domain of unknown function (DUF5655)